MRNVSRVSVVKGWILVWTLFCASLAFGEDYAIKWARPQKLGDTFSMSAKAKRTIITNAMFPGPIDSTREIEVRLDAKVEILAVDALGRATKRKITVERFARRLQGAETTPIQPGEVLIAEVGPDGRV